MSQSDRNSTAGQGGGQELIASILLVDDDEPFRRFLANFLRGQGYTVASASSGREGIALALEFTPDLIICDLDMPGMSGYEVLARLRLDPQLADTPVMFLTGQAAPEQIREGMNLGADDYLTKPLNSAELLRAVKGRLARAQAGRVHQEKQMERAMQMFAGVVHDLRDPLFVVFGYTNMLRQAGAPAASSSERAEEILDRMQRAISRMQTIVSETLFLAKSKMQRLPFDPSPFDLRILCEQVVADLDQQSRLAFECAETACDIVGDPLRLRQALENLLTNALKYSEKTVVLTLARTDSGYTVTVTDQGIGIPAAEHARVFDPFFRASNATAKPGHGLGLSIVKTCVEQHGGRVELVSKPGKGATFTLTLPFNPPAHPPGAELAADSVAQPLHLSPGDFADDPVPEAGEENAVKKSHLTGGSTEKPAKLTCLIVDDEPLVRDVLRDLLTNSGELQVIGEAGSVAQARQIIEKSAPEVVFLDIGLPDAPGFELLSYIAPTTAVVFISSAEEHAITAFDTDAVDYILKPVSAERLQRTLKRIRQRSVAAPAESGDTRLGLDDTFLVKTMSEKKLIKVRDVKCIMAYGEYSWVYWEKGKGALLRKPLKQWEKELPEAQFVRIHRHAIINLAFIERVEKLPSGRQQVHLRETPEPIAVSLRLAAAFNRKLKPAKR